MTMSYQLGWAARWETIGTYNDLGMPRFVATADALLAETA
jgi:hypothetical protein